MNYISLIHTVVDPFVQDPEALLIKDITEDKTKNDMTIVVCAPSTDIAKLIGKKGCVANAIRDIVSIAGTLESKKVHLKFESLEEENNQGE